MKILGKVKIVISVFGLALSLVTINAVNIHNQAATISIKSGKIADAEQSRALMYANLAITVVVMGASLKTLLRKTTYE